MLKFYEVRKILFEDAAFALINLREMFFVCYALKNLPSLTFNEF